MNKLLEFVKNKNFKLLVRNSFWMTSMIVVRQGFKIAFLAYVARLGGPEKLGIIQYALKVMITFSAVADIGLSAWSTIILPQKASAKDEQVSAFFALKGFFTLITAVAYILFVQFVTVSDEVRAVSYLFLLSMVLSDLLFDWPFRAFEKTEYLAIGSFVKYAFILLFVMAVKQLDILLSVPLAYGIGGGLNILLLFIFYRRAFDFDLKLELDLKKYFEIIRSAIPFGIETAFSHIYEVLPLLMVRDMIGESVVGYFGAAIGISGVLYRFGVAFSLITLPTLSRMKSENMLEFRKIMRFVISAMFLVSGGIVIAGLLWGDELFLLMYGAEFTAGIEISRQMIASVGIGYLSIFFKFLLSLFFPSRILVQLSSIRIVILSVLSYLVITYFGFSSIGLAFIIAEAISALITSGVFVREYRKAVVE